MNRIILEESEQIEDSLFSLNSRKSNHIIKILKSKIGDNLKVGLINKSIGIGTIESIDLKSRKVLISYKKEYDESELPIANLRDVRIFSSIQRPQTVKKIIQLAATSGISELFFFPAEKSEFTYLNSSIWSEENLLEEIILGLEQGGRIQTPKITVLKNKYRLKEQLTKYNRFILDFNGKYLLNSTLGIDILSPFQIVIGPESGFTEQDLSFFLDLGFEKISVSENILRSENAFAFILAQIELLKSSSTGK